MALVRALSKAAQVASKIKHGSLSIVDIFDRAMEEASDALQAKRKELDADQKEAIPLHVGSPVDAKAMNLARVARLNRANKLANGSGKKRGWGKLAVSVALGGHYGNAPPPTAAAAINPRIQFDNLLEKEELERQELRGAAASPLGAATSPDFARLEKSVAETRAESKARDEAVLARIGALEVALTKCVDSISNVVDQQQGSFQKRTPSMVRMRRNRLHRADTTSDIGLGSPASASAGAAAAPDVSASVQTAAELERRELREAEGSNGGLAPSVSHPFADSKLDA